MNPHMRPPPPGYQGPGGPHGMMPGQPMMPGNPMMQGQPRMPGNPMMQGQMNMMQRPMMNSPMGPGVRMGAPPPPSYNQALVHSNHGMHRGPVRQGAPNQGRPKQPTEKERYFMQQQARLKQFGRGAATSSMDPSKLIDSMFGDTGPQKHAPTPKQSEQPQAKPTAVTDNADDGFGDFLGGNNTINLAFQAAGSGAPGNSSVLQSVAGGDPVQGISSAPVAAPLAPDLATSQTVSLGPTSPNIHTKDLSAMMLESCNLSGPTKSHGFHKPTLKEINPADRPQVGPHQHHKSDRARHWDDNEELTQLFSTEEIKVSPHKTLVKKVSKGSLKAKPFPTWLTDASQQHPVYRQVLEACLVENEISTERLYPILLLSGLHKEMLGTLWGLCNKTTPGTLTPPELSQLLALIALVQNQNKVEDVDILKLVPQCPLPLLAPPGNQQGPAAIPQQTAGNDVIIPDGSQPNASHQPTTHSGGVLATGNQAVGTQLSMGMVPQSAIAPGTQSASTFNVPPSQVMAFGMGQSPPISGPPGSVSMPERSGFTTPISNPALGHNLNNQGNFMVTAPSHLPVSSGPATLPVTQLPSGGLSPSSSTNVVDDDDFADFQAAVPSPAPSTESGSGLQSPKENFMAGMVQVTPEKVMAASISGVGMKTSTVENFFGNDDSSETASPDDDYFDGYKSPDSKPSDSSSQFSTDQSDGDDFKNFDSYLDEFQRKRDQQEKESPLHRPVSKVKTSPLPQVPISSAIPPKISLAPLPKQNKPTAHGVGQGHIGTTIASAPSLLNAAPKIDSGDDFEDFADFHSAPMAPPTVGTVSLSAGSSASTPTLTSAAIATPANPIQDLIGDEDKYAALRFAAVDVAPPSNDLLANQNKADDNAEESDDWADFEGSAPITELEQTAGDKMTGTASQDQIVGNIGWTVAEQSISNVATEDDWADFQDSKASFALSDDVSQSASVSTSDTASQGIIFPTSESAAELTSQQPTVLVQVKKELNSNEILGLFKVKSDSATTQQVKSKDDDFLSVQSVPVLSASESMNRLHGIRAGSSSPDSLNLPAASPNSGSMDTEDNFFAPPPMDDYKDEENDEYSRGYDFGDALEPSSQERKKVYGIYGVNENFVVDGNKKKPDVSIKSKLSDPHLHIESDNDSDSMKDYDMFKGKLGVTQAVEDSQSIASLEFVMNKNLQVSKDDGETQSQSSAEISNFELGPNSEATLPESKSLDSLDLRDDNVNMNDALNIGPTLNDNDRPAVKELPMESSAMSMGMPVLGDRYSAILPPEPSSSDKPSVEWQRCLESCLQMIQQANNIFNSISSSDVCNEVMDTSQGTQYVEGIIEIYRVVSKITQAMQNTGIQTDKLSKLLKDIDLAWNNLAAFLVGRSVMPEPTSLDFSMKVPESVPCGLCLLGINIANNGGQLTYAGNQYHASCANFWINCVDSCLPALSLPQLL